MYKYLLIVGISVAVSGCALSNKTVKKDNKEYTDAKTTHFTAKMIKDVKARRAKYLKNHKQ